VGKIYTVLSGLAVVFLLMGIMVLLVHLRAIR
jgi:hypothetical protein